ncbi:hypothetical protein IE4771_PA00184 (plasmid) [Rhizobium etli bv. mimosae str. IE4771]|uniref:Uncharacterized protein n=1 Tax=Rhizobium etli bv. mimosae str. IE4771 TaxID=1432050 RepID=A0A060ICA4_RHIET|nr:hypothetical protein IE4771_PA00184 [Rhizobium sp. IE4771]
MAAFLPVPPQQLFPSGGLLTFTLHGPRFPLAHFFISHLSRSTSSRLQADAFLQAGGVSRRNEKQAREKRRKREMNRSQSSRLVAASAQPPPPHTATRPSQGCKPRSSFAAAMLGRSCTQPPAPRSGKCLRKE